MVTGYKIYVDWIESTAMDLLLLDWLQYYYDIHKFLDSFRGAYRNLVDVISLKVFRDKYLPFYA